MVYGGYQMSNDATSLQKYQESGFQNVSQSLDEGEGRKNCPQSSLNPQMTFIKNGYSSF